MADITELASISFLFYVGIARHDGALAIVVMDTFSLSLDNSRS